MIFKKKNKESKPKKEKKVPVMKVDTHRKKMNLQKKILLCI